MADTLTQDELRKICWELGSSFPIAFGGNRISLATIHPSAGFLNWHLEQEAVDALAEGAGDRFHGATLTIRIHDVTDVLFDGTNSHGHFDIYPEGLHGSHRFHAERIERNLLAEVGFRLNDGHFCSLARSNTVFFDRDRPTGDVQVGGMFVGRGFQPMFAVENVFDAPVYERINCALATLSREGPLHVAVVFQGLDGETEWKGPMGQFVRQVGQACGPFQVEAVYFPDGPASIKAPLGKPLTEVVQAVGTDVAQQIVALHRERGFSVLHCHDWYSLPAGLEAAERGRIPFVFSLHSTEHERTHGGDMDSESETICAWERRGVDLADMIIVPHSSTRRQVINVYGADPEQVVIIPDKIAAEREAPASPQDLKGSFGLDPMAPVVLFAGEMSHAAGVDLMMEALPGVCAGHGNAQFVFAGDGPLKGELEQRAWHTGVGHRCRFFGHVPGDRFESLLMASDFVVIPARTWQDEGLAQWAIACGRPVLTTHSAQIRCVVHSQNGLVTYDNPGSIVWGIKELLANPIQGQMLRAAARLAAASGPSIETIAAEHYLCYENAIRTHEGERRG